MRDLDGWGVVFRLHYTTLWNILSVQVQVCTFVTLTLFWTGFCGVGRRGKKGSFSCWTQKVQSLASNPRILRVASVICHYGVNRQPDSQLVKSLSTCVCVETVAHLRRNAVYCGHTFQLYCLCFCSSLSVRARLHEGEGTEEAGGWMDRSLLSLGFFFFIIIQSTPWNIESPRNSVFYCPLCLCAYVVLFSDERPISCNGSV